MHEPELEVLAPLSITKWQKALAYLSNNILYISKLYVTHPPKLEDRSRTLTFPALQQKITTPNMSNYNSITLLKYS